MASSTSPFPPIRRIVTGHNHDALAIVSRNDIISSQPRDDGFSMARIWTTEEHPADIASTEDKGLKNPGLAPTGSTLAIFDMPPKSRTTLHRTITLDYIIVQKGQVVLVLDDGSRTSLKEGDIVVQQATMHDWENETDNWTRLIAVMAASQHPVINGTTLSSILPH